MRRISIAVLLAALVGACATIERSEASRTEDVLAAAGFRPVPADTKPRIDALRSMEPRTLSRLERGGETYFVYPDPTNCNCLYVGKEVNYQEYKRLELQREIADEQIMAAEDAEEAAFDWNVWGPWY